MANAYLLFKSPSLLSEVLNLGSFPGSTQMQKPVRQPPQKSEHWMSGPVPSFPSQEESGSQVFPLNHMMLC